MQPVVKAVIPIIATIAQCKKTKEKEDENITLYNNSICSLCVQANAACIATPSCTAMGYTSTSSCTNGIKCPFGEYWNCDLVNKIAELETKLNQQQQKERCIIGSILYSDMTCSVTVIAGKAPIGIVVYSGPSGYQALALESIGDYEWSSEYVDISGLTNYTSASAASKDYDSCGNSKKIMAAGNKSKYPAVWAANEYKTAGTEAGDWCLPAAGIFTSYYNNQDLINIGFSRAKGTQFTTRTRVWASSGNDVDSGWFSHFDSSYGLFGKNLKDSSYEIRPVLEF